MPNDEHVAMLARGAAAWNEWRAKDDEAPDLSRASLRGLDLSGFDLSRADLRGADLRGTNLSGANLLGAHLVFFGLNARIEMVPVMKRSAISATCDDSFIFTTKRPARSPPLGK
jgi:hypothetical protein